MLLRRPKNRRTRSRVDVAATAKAHAPVAFKLFGAALSVIALGFGGQLAWGHAQVSPQFAVKVVDVHGNSRASDAELLKLSGVEGQNMFQLDLDAVERSLASHPWVRTAKATRHFPSRLSIAVTEHEPAAVVSLGELYLVDHDGLPFKRLQPQDGLDLTLITGLDRDGYTERPLEGHERIAAALSVIAMWKPQPAEVRTSGQGVTVVQSDGVEVRLGEGDLEAKLSRLAVIKRELQSRKLEAQVIRLDNRMRPDWVTVQLTGTAQK